MADAHFDSLHHFDLNLLRVLDTVLDERSIARAAQRLHRTPSAVSHALRRLRDALDDPILRRDGSRMVPTARAVDAHVRVKALLGGVQSLLANEAVFEPARLSRSFHLGMSDYAAAVALEPIVPLLRKQAPGVRLVVHHLGRDDGTQTLRQGLVELGLGVFPGLTRDLRSEPVVSESYCCAVWKKSRVARGPLTMERYLALEHVNIMVRGDSLGLVDNALAQRGQRRSIAMVVPHFLVAPRLLRGTDLVLTAPERLLHGVAAACELKLFKPPIALPRFRMQLIWAQRNDGDPALRWLIGSLAAALRTRERRARG